MPGAKHTHTHPHLYRQTRRKGAQISLSRGLARSPAFILRLQHTFFHTLPAGNRREKAPRVKQQECKHVLEIDIISTRKLWEAFGNQARNCRLETVSLETCKRLGLKKKQKESFFLLEVHVQQHQKRENCENCEKFENHKKSTEKK